jgi:hypothetical protein
VGRKLGCSCRRAGFLAQQSDLAPLSFGSSPDSIQRRVIDTLNDVADPYDIILDDDAGPTSFKKSAPSPQARRGSFPDSTQASERGLRHRTVDGGCLRGCGERGRNPVFKGGHLWCG